MPKKNKKKNNFTTKIVTPHYDAAPSSSVIYNSFQFPQHQENLKQENQKLFHVVNQIIISSFSIKILYYLIYNFVIKYEADMLIEDIKRINKRFVSNSYARIINEFNIFTMNSFDINSFKDSHNCFLFGVTKLSMFPESKNMISELLENVFNNNFDTEFFVEIYSNGIKQYFGIGPDLDTLKKFVTPYVDLDYDINEKNYLRGAHSQLKLIRDVYNKKLNRYAYKSDETYDENNEGLAKFTQKIKNMIANPDIMMCNHISSQNNVNINNFKENFMNVNQISIKDLYSNILDVQDGLISVRIQNSISKSVYVVVFFSIIATSAFVFKKIKNYLRKI